ncbi:MAG: sulfatase, partial [Planctomycetota bacterium]
MSFRRLFLATAFLHLAGFSAAAGAADGRPNVVVVMADDCTFRDLGTYGGQAATPNLDRLAAEGMLFERCFQSAPMCSPTRHALYTGLEPVRSGAYPNHTRVYPDVKCVVQYLHALDYTVHLSGKSHVSPPQVFAWDTATGGNSAGNNPDMAEIDKLFAARADGEKPFCLFAMSNEPHGPWDKGDPSAYPPSSLTVPPHLADTPLLRHIYSKYLAEITYFDGQVGQILDLLDRHGLADDTLVIVLSEQGDGFTAAKWFCYDNSLQSGLIARWPGRIAAGTRTDAMVGYIDIVSTIVEAAGGTAPPGIDGRSFLGVLSGSETSHRYLTFGLQTTRGIHNGSDAY